MNIAIDISRVNREKKTGVEWYVFFLVQELKKLNWLEHTVVLYSDSEVVGELAELPKNWSIKVLNWPPKRFWTQIRLSLEIIFHKPDVLFIPAHVLPLILPKKSVITIHDIAAVTFPQAYSLFERWFSVWSAKRAVKTCSSVLVPSEFTKQELLTHIGGSAQNIHVTHLGYDIHFGRIEKNAAKLPKDLAVKTYILNIGRKEKKKNTKRIIQAFELVKKEHQEDLQLVLVGKPGYGYEEVQEDISNSPNKQDIIELGWTSTEELTQILAHAEVFVFPSLYEGFGIPVLESWASHTPVVCSNTTSLKEIAGSAAELVNPLSVQSIAKGIQKILQNPEYANQLRERGSEEVKNYSWEQLAKETQEVLLNT